MSPSSAATVALRLILCPNLCVLCQTSALWSWSPESGGSLDPALQSGAHPPLSPALPGKIRGILPAHFPGHLSETGARRAGSIPAQLPESHQDAGFEQGFSRRESGHFRISRKDFWPWHDSSHIVMAPGRAGRPRAAMISTAIGRDALVCGGQRAADPALAPGDWLSGRAPRSHRGGHWFDPSIAHPSHLR